MDSRQLVLIRQFFSEARLTPAAETPFLRMRRALHLDLCIELALNAVVRDHGTAEEQSKQGGPRDLPWHSLWDLADGASQRKLNRCLPERSALKTLHDLRNLAQHRGTAPSAEDVRATVEPVRTLLEFVCRDFYGLDFERLREWDVLEHDLLRWWLDDCYEAADRGASIVAVAGCKLAFERIVDCVKDATAGGDWRALQGGITQAPSREIAELLTKVMYPILVAVQSLEAEICAVSLGLPIGDHYRFLWCAEGVILYQYAGGQWDARAGEHWPAKPENAHANALFVVGYLGKACVLLENAFPGALAGLKLPPRLRESTLWEKQVARG